MNTLKVCIIVLFFLSFTPDLICNPKSEFTFDARSIIELSQLKQQFDINRKITYDIQIQKNNDLFEHSFTLIESFSPSTNKRIEINSSPIRKFLEIECQLSVKHDLSYLCTQLTLDASKVVIQPDDFFLESNFQLNDFFGRNIDEDSHRIKSETFDTFTILSTPKSTQGRYGLITWIIDKTTFLPRSLTFYDKNMNLIKTLIIRKTKQIDSDHIPSQLIMISSKSNFRTVIDLIDYMPLITPTQ